MLRHRLYSEKGRSMGNTLDHVILYGQMDDGGQRYRKMGEADGQRCK